MGTNEQLIVAVVPILASLLANTFKVKEGDSKCVVLLKKAINLLALNFSQNAGK